MLWQTTTESFLGLTFDLQGRPLPGPPLPPVSSVGQMLAITGGDVLFDVSYYLQPSAWYRFDANGKSVRTALFRTSPFNFDDAEVVRDFVTSKDGTRVPVNIIRRVGTSLDGSNPTLLEGYGGYGVSMKPFFLGSFARIWLDQGGIYAIANLRGGAEYGEEWHRAGNLTRKQNVFDDFIACAQHLIERLFRPAISSLRLSVVCPFSARLSLVVLRCRVHIDVHRCMGSSQVGSFKSR